MIVTNCQPTRLDLGRDRWVLVRRLSEFELQRAKDVRLEEAFRKLQTAEGRADFDRIVNAAGGAAVAIENIERRHALAIFWPFDFGVVRNFGVVDQSIGTPLNEDESNGVAIEILRISGVGR